MADEHKDLKLAAPGAGLPFVERLVSRTVLKIYAAWATKDQVLRRFQLEAEAAIALVEPLSEEAAKTPVLIPRPLGLEDSSRNWSAAMTLEHLVIVNLGIAGIIRALGSDEPELTEVRIEDVKPSEAAGLEQIERLRRAVEIYERTIKQQDDLRTPLRHPHPWFGPLDARGWHALAAIHNGLHRRQIQMIVRKL